MVWANIRDRQSVLACAAGYRCTTKSDNIHQRINGQSTSSDGLANIRDRRPPRISAPVIDAPQEK
jgi:hypothetical protein